MKLSRPGLSKQDHEQIGLLLTPSWLSGLAAVLIGLMISIGVLVAFEAHNSLLQQQLLSWQQPQAALTTPSQTLVQNDRPTLEGSWPLLVIWSVAGLVVYMIAASVVRSISEAEELRESLDYVNANPRSALMITAEHVVLRLIAGVLLISFLVGFWHDIVPYSITASHASAADVWSLDGILYSLLAFVLIAISVHIGTILLRLSLGRARVFSD